MAPIHYGFPTVGFDLMLAILSKGGDEIDEPFGEIDLH